MASSTSILVHNKKILFILRDNKQDIPDPNAWQLPGGGVEGEEDYLQAIRRELQEEIGIVPQQLKYLGMAPGETAVFFAFLSDEEIERVKLGNEGQELDFLSTEEALQSNLTKKLRFYMEKFKDGISELIDTGVVSDLSRIGLSNQALG